MNYKVGDYVILIKGHIVCQISLIKDFNTDNITYNGRVIQIGEYYNEIYFPFENNYFGYYFQFKDIRPIPNKCLKQIVFK